jgi:hypothetical protein
VKLKKSQSQKTLDMFAKNRQKHLPFSPFDDKEGFNGCVPSGPYLKDQLLRVLWIQKTFFTFETQRRDCRSLAIDHTFNVNLEVVFCLYYYQVIHSYQFNG